MSRRHKCSIILPKAPSGEVVSIAAVYYVEVNLICILLLVLFSVQMRYRSDRASEENRAFSLMLWVTMLLCTVDMIAGVCRGRHFPGAGVLVSVSNLLYFEAISAVSYLWLLYVLIRLKLLKDRIRSLLICAVPLLGISALTLSNPWTGFLFTIDENNRYSRGSGVWWHWLVTWSYLLISTGITIAVMLRNRNRHKRRKQRALLCFAIPPAVAAIVQMRFYGISCFQVGITLSIAIVSLMEQNAQMLTDPLTGLNNRYGFDRYCENYLQRSTALQMSVMMIDVDRFKQVNDRFGHLEGDRALTDVAYAVRHSCEKVLSHLFMCRYGGDEFLVVGECDRAVMDTLAAQIQRSLEYKNWEERYPYPLSVSIGIASGGCSNPEDMDCLLRQADETMYRAKGDKRFGRR